MVPAIPFTSNVLAFPGKRCSALTPTRPVRAGLECSQSAPALEISMALTGQSFRLACRKSGECG